MKTCRELGFCLTLCCGFQANEHIIGSNAESAFISTATLHIIVEGLKQIDLTIVDIPGLVRGIVFFIGLTRSC
jgi:hypothetical protein